MSLRERCQIRRCLSAFLVFFAAGCSTVAPENHHPESVSTALSHALTSGEWLTYGHDYSNSRFSPLREINTENAFRLAPAYVVQTGVVGPLEATPIVSDGVMYLSTAYDGVLAVNAMNGELLWVRPPIKGHFRLCCGPVNRGVALTDSLVLIGQLDGVLVALDRKTGHLRWATTVGDNAAGYSITMAPLVYGDSVFVGVAGSEFSIRGSLSSYSLRNGTLQWRWYSTDPESWFGHSTRLRTDDGTANEVSSATLRRRFTNSWKHGGGGIWATPAIDPATNTIFVAIGNPWPDSDGRRRPGDNLYTDSIVALDASTGRLKWFFQQTPHDIRDLDAASPPVLFDTIDNSRRTVPAIGDAGKTGYFYILNRNTGALIRRSENLASVSKPSDSSQTYDGGTTWSPVSLDKSLGIAVVCASQHLKLEQGSATSQRFHGSFRGANWNSGIGTVSALNLATGRVVWQDQFDVGLVGGSVSTAGDLTFVGEGSGYFDALDSKTGLRLWRFQTGAGVNAAPTVFEEGGTEFVAVSSGGNQQLGTRYGDAIFVFELPSR